METRAEQEINLHLQGSPVRSSLEPYLPEKHHDYVRLLVTAGLLLVLLWLVVWASRESAASAAQWTQTKEMIQIIFPAITGLLGSVIGFYFGSGVAASSKRRI